MLFKTDFLETIDANPYFLFGARIKYWLNTNIDNPFVQMCNGANLWNIIG